MPKCVTVKIGDKYEIGLNTLKSINKSLSNQSERLR